MYGKVRYIVFTVGVGTDKPEQCRPSDHVLHNLPLIQHPASVAPLDARPTGDQEVACSAPPGRQHSFVALDEEIFSTISPFH